MDTIIPVTLSARHVKAAERLAREQESDMTPATYIESVVLHVLRGQAEQLAREEAQAIVDAYDAATPDIQRQVQRVLGLSSPRLR